MYKANSVLFSFFKQVFLNTTFGLHSHRAVIKSTIGQQHKYLLWKQLNNPLKFGETLAANSQQSEKTKLPDFPESKKRMLSSALLGAQLKPAEAAPGSVTSALLNPL